jgi:methylisocitrate lyase
MTTVAERRARFHELHRSGCFLIPNPWDAGSAYILERLGVAAIATSSAALAWSLGRRDGRIALGQALDHFRAVVAAVNIPVNADFEGAFAVQPVQVAANVAAAAGTGLSGLSVEDRSGNSSDPLFDFTLSVERVLAAREALDAAGANLVLTARSEGFVVGRPDLDETIRRLNAYADAGADCLFAPGLRTQAEIGEVVRAVAPRPVNALVTGSFATVADLAALGVRRISVGGALARTAWAAFLGAAREIIGEGTFTALDAAVPGPELNGMFEDRS